MRDNHLERRDRNKTRDRSRDRSRERKSRDHGSRRHEYHHSRDSRRRSRSRSIERRREKNRSQERNKRENNRSQTKAQHQSNEREDFHISPMSMDEEIQEDIESEAAEMDTFPEERKHNGNHSTLKREIPINQEKRISALEQAQTAKMSGINEIKNSYIKENLVSQATNVKENITLANKELPIIKQATVQTTKQRIVASEKEIISTTTKEANISSISVAPKQISQEPSDISKKQLAKSKEKKPQVIIPRELLQPSETRNESAKRQVDEFLTSIQKQKRELPRLEKAHQVSKIESIVSDKGERVLIKKKPETPKGDLRVKINVAEDTSKSILSRITKRP